MRIVGSRSPLPVPVNGKAGDERAAKRIKLGDHDAEPDTFAQRDFASGNSPYGGFVPAAPPNWNMHDSIDPGLEWDAAGSAVTVRGFLLPLLLTADLWKTSQMPTMDPCPGMVDLVSFPFYLM
jgi:hypothetical protein